MLPDASTPVRTTGELDERLRRRLRITSVIWACAAALIAATAVVSRRATLQADPSSFWMVSPLPGPLLVVSLLHERVRLGPVAASTRWSREVARHRMAWRCHHGHVLRAQPVLHASDLFPDRLGRPMEMGVALGAPWGTLIVAYGVLIPSSLRHCVMRTMMIAACAFLPELLIVPGLERPVRGIAFYLALKTIMVAVLGALALYGHIASSS